MIALLLWACIIAIGFTFLLVFDVVAIRLTQGFNAWRAALFIKKWSPLLKNYLLSTSTTAAFYLKPRTLRSLILWGAVGQEVNPEAQRKLALLGKELRLAKLALSLLRGRSYENKLIALTAIGYLGDASTWGLVVPLAYSSNLALSLRALETLTRIDSSLAAPFILEQFPLRADWPLANILELLGTISPTLITEYVQQVLQNTDTSKVQRLIPFLSLLPQKDRTALLLKQMTLSTSTETLVACLKLVSQPKEMPLTREFVSSGTWQVRAEAASALGRVGNQLDKDLLDPLLCDPIWWVRQRSAEAISSIPGIKPKEIREMILLHPDLFTRGIS